jgi:hypothetical protein
MMAGTTMIAPIAVTVRHRAVKRPKSFIGPILDPSRTRNPPTITSQLYRIALPLWRMVLSIDFMTFRSTCSSRLYQVMKWIEKSIPIPIPMDDTSEVVVFREVPEKPR